MDEIKSKTQKPYKKPLSNYNIIFPTNIDFYFLALYEKIKDFPTTDLNDPEYICIIFENKEKQIQENKYKRKYFINDYEFIKVIEKKSNSDINFIIAKEKMNYGDRGTRLLSEIKRRLLLIEEINKRTKINFNAEENIYLKDSFSVPKELKFFNRIFHLYFVKQNYTTIQNNQNIINNNLNNIIINNNQFQNNAYYNTTYINNNIYNLNKQNPQIIGYTGNNLSSKTPIININNVNGQNNGNISFNKNGNLNNSVNTAQINNQMNYIENQKNLIDNAEKKNETEKNLEGTNENNNQQGKQPNIPKLNYIFSKRGLKNIGSTCYMNATLQCLLHVSELVIYFLQEYEKDKLILNEKNKNIE